MHEILYGTQRDLAHKAGVSRVLISHTERAKKNVSQNAWEGICKAFEMPLEEVFPGYLSGQTLMKIQGSKLSMEGGNHPK